MVYLFFDQKGKAEAEEVFPQGKRGFYSGGRFFFLFLLLLTALFTSVFARAEPFVQQVKNDLAAYAGQMAWPKYREEIITWLPGKGKQLPECGQEVSFELANHSRPPLGRVHYVISCASPKWQVRAQAKVKVWLDVWHARNDIAVDQVITAADVYLKNIEISRLNREFFTAGQKVVNKRSVRRIRGGKIINAGQLQNVYLVKKGEEVLIRAQQGNFVATMKGTALENGMLGEKIRIENASSKKVIQGRVAGQGIVETLF
ncbi:flagellar basal body P-ring formation protein FlgA [Thalassomonas viridans]|uniref:Flagella basal body P-ring formation protein FlgA n=1 Tax=Thalassomonas viridans TaxID=137584 RepID=A0AAE9Z323_9GAMM|nr:flagellar basal body P-ring formation chaperone FlgA [Thalassomonas viridans]WDE05169.1 flagellar basal body P-ring formation protein FlgA [Thalassomonas viridans]